MIFTKIEDYKTNIARHAYRELMLIGMFDGDEYNEKIAKNILDLCELFGAQEHSGFTAEYVTDIFNKVARYKTLSNITNNPEEWEDVSKISDEAEGTIFQNKRDCSVFSMDGLKTWKSVDEKIILNKVTTILNESLIKRKKMN